MQRTVRELVRQKLIPKVPTISENAKVRSALALFRESQSDFLLVLRGDQPVGIFTERDFTRKAEYTDPWILWEKSLAEVLDPVIAYVTPEYRLEECMGIMARKKINSVLVLDGDQPWIALSMRHIMDALVEDREFVIEELTKYITGSPRIEAAKTSSYSGH